MNKLCTEDVMLINGGGLLITYLINLIKCESYLVVGSY